VPYRQAITRLDRHPAQAGLAPVADPGRPYLHPRPPPLSRL